MRVTGEFSGGIGDGTPGAGSRAADRSTVRQGMKRVVAEP